MVMVAAPAPLPTWWPSHPVSVICPHCQVEVSTTVTHETGLGTWLIAGGICFVGCFAGCCLIPFCVDSCKDHNHYCGKCTRFLGKSKII
ncbi:hypothetical protein HYH03_010626 [Edaphochlamys debaryana]|uniref:LITAF domain-containing protein n=1 Tax=Edaphochlamys debaryana TaxID=47281 RepID=A0A835XW76_9CHLO|nr:hypothetical protein HYH03_010626 [Edaphochlamys debaryana]|eukprot:KAG2490949.1 hypothetical protein HYH03_010626 [Edaphochlamys debaryana]